MSQIKIAIMGHHDEKVRVLKMLKSGLSRNSEISVDAKHFDEHAVNDVGKEPVVIYYGVVPSAHVEPRTDKVIYLDVHPLDETNDDRLYKAHVIKSFKPEDLLFVQYPRKRDSELTHHDRLWRMGPQGDLSVITTFIMNAYRQVKGVRVHITHSAIKPTKPIALPS